MMRIAFIWLVISTAVAAFAQLPPSVVPPLPVITNSPVQIFRRLLAMTEQERQQYLAARSPESQAVIREKLKEFLALDSLQREARLQSLELRALLLPLMNAPASNRAEYLAALPAQKRKLVEDKLRVWDILPPPLRDDVLANEKAVRFLTQVRSGENAEQLMSGMSSAQRTQLEKEVTRFNELPEARREITTRNVEKFFGLDAPQRSHALSSLTANERAVVTNAVARLSILPPPKRELAVEGLKKFKLLSPAEQQEFMRTAARWQSMTEKERDLWRQLVARTRPPLPPPMPPPPKQSPNLSLATNQ